MQYIVTRAFPAPFECGEDGYGADGRNMCTDPEGSSKTEYYNCDPLSNSFSTDIELHSCAIDNTYTVCGASTAPPTDPLCLTPPCLPPGDATASFSLIDPDACNDAGTGSFEITTVNVSLKKAYHSNGNTSKVYVYVTAHHSLPPGDELRIAVKLYDKTANKKLSIAHGWLTTTDEASVSFELNKDFVLTNKKTMSLLNADGLRFKVKKTSVGNTPKEYVLCQNWKIPQSVRM